MIKTQDMLIIDCLEYVNWDRKLFEHAKSSGLNIIHVTIAYWENTKETHNNFKKWDEHFKKHDDLIMPIHDYDDIHKAIELNKIKNTWMRL